MSGTNQEIEGGNNGPIPTTPTQIGVSVDGLGSAIQVGSLGFSLPNFPGTIYSWSVIGDVVGDVVIDIKVGGVSIVGAGNKPTIVAGTSASASVAGWTTDTFVANTAIEYEITSVTAFKRLNLVLNLIP